MILILDKSENNFVHGFTIYLHIVSASWPFSSVENKQIDQ